MKLAAIIDAPGITKGKEYEVSKHHIFGLCFVNDVNYDVPFSEEIFGSPLMWFKALWPTADKVLLSNPGGKNIKYTVELITTELYFIVHSHSRGNHWNISGNHYRYYHDRLTGSYLPNDGTIRIDEEMFKCRILAKDYKEYISVIDKKQKTN